MGKYSNHSYKSTKNSKKSNYSLFLEIEVLQAGSIQIQKIFKSNGLLRQKIALGANSNSILHIPFGTMSLPINLFEIKSGRIYSILDNRLTGFVNDGNQFGEVREFIAPRGSIAEIASISEPLKLELLDGSRGSLLYQDFQIVFKVHRGIKKENVIKIAGAGRNFFALPSFDVALERQTIVLAGFLSIIMVSAVIVWLLKAPREEFTGLESLPYTYAMEVIHPQHFRYLPWIYRDQFNRYDAVSQVVNLISELQKRWQAEEAGTPYSSKIPAIAAFSRDRYPRTMQLDWKKSIDAAYEKLEKRRVSSESPRYFKFQKEYPRILLEVSGGLYGSLDVRMNQRIQQLKQMYASIKDRVQSEQGFLKSHYGDLNLKINEHFSPPKAIAGFSPKSAPEYEFDLQQFIAAEGLAKRAQESAFRESRENHFEKVNRDRLSIVWLGKDSMIVPNLFKTQFGWTQNGAENLLENARYSASLLQIPPLPPPKATIDFKDVELVILGKREELRSCYDAALRANPKLAGKITWQWRVLENGTASSIAAIENSVNDQNLASCMKNRILSWKFPRPRNGSVVVSYPFKFVINNQSGQNNP